MSVDEAGLARLQRRQRKVAAYEQLVALGVTAARIRWQVGRHWRLLLPGVFLLSRDEPVLPFHRSMAAQLWGGPTAALAATTAAQMHGIKSIPQGGPTQLVIPNPGASRRHPLAVVRRTVLDDDVRARGPLRLSSPARSCVDSAVMLRTESDRSAVIIEAVQRRISSLDDLIEWGDRLRPRDRAKLLPAFEAAVTGAWSVPESELLELVDSSTVLPSVWANPMLDDADGVPLVSPDAWLDDVGMAIMIHSRQHHSSSRDWTRTVQQDGDLTSRGCVVVGVTPNGLREDRVGTLRRIEQTYEHALRRPRPPVVATPRHAIILS